MVCGCDIGNLPAYGQSPAVAQVWLNISHCFHGAQSLEFLWSQQALASGNRAPGAISDNMHRRWITGLNGFLDEHRLKGADYVNIGQGRGNRGGTAMEIEQQIDIWTKRLPNALNQFFSVPDMARLGIETHIGHRRDLDRVVAHFPQVGGALDECVDIQRSAIHLSPASTQMRVDADPIPYLPTEQLPNGHAQVLTFDIPASLFYRAHGGETINAERPECYLAEQFNQLGHVARIMTHDNVLEVFNAADHAARFPF